MKQPVDVLRTVREYIRREDLLAPGERILAAVSGGADSLCLLLALNELGYALSVCHFDHGLRPDSRRDLETVRLAAERLGLPFFAGSGDVRKHAAENRTSLEEAARDLRYGFLANTARVNDIPTVAVGHTKDDQAETVLMHLLRGAGLRGLGGIRPAAGLPVPSIATADAKIRLVRPLLCLTHAQADIFCRSAGWTPQQDSSNRDLSFTRNRIRRELIPLLERYNPMITDALSRLASMARVQDDCLEGMADEVWRKSARTEEPECVRIRRKDFDEAHPAIQQILVRRAIWELKGGVTDLTYRHVCQLVDFVGKPAASNRIELALGVAVSIEGDWLAVHTTSGKPTTPDWEEQEIVVPGVFSLQRPRWKVEASLVEAEDVPEPGGLPDPWTAWMDLGKIRPPLRLRRRRTGDRFHPQGMPNPVRISGFFSSHRLPFRQRDHWPLVCDTEGIVWVPGYRLRAGIAPTTSTTCCVMIRIQALKK
jgi:tRNA(Ile)-lysidine synthase